MDSQEFAGRLPDLFGDWFVLLAPRAPTPEALSMAGRFTLPIDRWRWLCPPRSRPVLVVERPVPTPGDAS